MPYAQAARRNLSHDLADHVRDLILDETLPAGRRVNEVHLAAKLGVSRTPLREALMRLVSEGAITTVPRIGFFVCALSEDEARQIYPIRSILDPAALKLAGIPDRPALVRLKAMNRAFGKARNAKEAIQRDDEWHLRLLEGCPNTILLELIQQFMWRTRRYELGLMAGRANVKSAAATNIRIIAALEDGNLPLACKELEGSMARAIVPVLEWLRRRSR